MKASWTDSPIPKITENLEFELKLESSNGLVVKITLSDVVVRDGKAVKGVFNFTFGT